MGSRAVRRRSPGTRARPCSRRSTGSRCESPPRICRCACRCRRSMPSTSGASSRAASKAAASRSATRSRSGRAGHARARALETWRAPREGQGPRAAGANRSIGLTLDQPVMVERGDVIAASAAPCQSTRRLRARVFWLHDAPLAPGASVTVRIGMAECRGEIAAIANVVDPGELAAHGWTAIARNNVGDVEIALAQPVAVDLHAASPRTGRLVLEVDGLIAGGGLVLALEDEKTPRGPSGGTGGGGRPSVRADDLGKILRGLSPAERIARLRHELDGKIVFTTSFGLEDQVILHLMASAGADIDIDVVTLDTGRLFRETYDLWAETERRYARRIRAVYPASDDLEAFVDKYGINGFYDSRDARAACCQARKVVPLARALAGASAWIVGLRADQSGNRHGTDVVSRDEGGLIKVSPLFDWTREAVQAFAVENEVPLNPLHAAGFVSIGCAPCTRAIAPGEPERAGRWWWETDDKKECGLHSRPGSGLATA